MTARAIGFVTREACGLRKPRSISRNIRPASGGVAVHYGGPAVSIPNHLTCLRVWRGWQDFHMDGHGWVDIAYTMGYCQHGYVFAGRGAGIRTAAQGTNDGNDRFYAAVWLGGAGQVPTTRALDALEWCVAELRRSGGAGLAVKPHSSFHTTECPGDLLRAFSKRLEGKSLSPVPPTPPAPKPKPSPIPVPPAVQEENMYALVKVKDDPRVYAVRHGVWKHVPNQESLRLLRIAGLCLNDGRIIEMSQAEAHNLHSFVGG